MCCTKGKVMRIMRIMRVCLHSEQTSQNVAVFELSAGLRKRGTQSRNGAMIINPLCLEWCYPDGVRGDAGSLSG